jgi:hypothetical protein
LAIKLQQKVDIIESKIKKTGFKVNERCHIPEKVTALPFHGMFAILFAEGHLFFNYDNLQLSLFAREPRSQFHASSGHEEDASRGHLDAQVSSPKRFRGVQKG